MIDYTLFILASYALLGAGIKYIDQAYDLGVFSKTKANMAAVLCGLLMAYFIVTDPPSTAIFLAMVIALAITRKIDNIAFYIGIGIVLLLPIVFNSLIKMTWLPFGVLTVSGILDELGNDWADKRTKKRQVNRYQKNAYWLQFSEKFFIYRFAMKVAILVLVILNYFDWIYLVAFMLFDLTYLLVDAYSLSIKVYNINKVMMPVTK